MTEYNAIATVDVAPTPKRAEQWLDALAGYSPAVSHSPDNNLAEVVITLEAAVLEAASAEALAVLSRTLGQLRSFEIMTTAEYDRRTELIGDPDYIGATEAARLLGVTRQRIQQMAASNVLPSIRIGDKTLGFSRVKLRAIAMRRVSGAQLMAAASDVIKRRPDLQPSVKSLMPKLADVDRAADAPISPDEERVVARLFDLFDQADVPWPTPTLDLVRG